MFLKKKIFFISFFILSLSLLFFYKFNNKEGYSQIGGDFELTNHLGKKITTKSFNGYYRLVFFGFTNCPDFCPDTLNKISFVMDEIDNKNKLVPIFITVDPERDGVENLKKYLSNFDPKIIGLTGTNEQINSIKKNYKIFSKKIMDMEENKEHDHDGHNHGHGGYAVDHTTIIYLMDKKGNYISHFSPDISNSDMIKRINGYL